MAANATLPKYDIRTATKKIFDRVGAEYFVLPNQVVIDQHSFIKVQHVLCNAILDIQIKGFVSPENKGRCKVCYPPPVRSTVRLTESDIVKRFEKVTKGEYTYIEGFFNTKSKMLIKHNTCGNSFEASSHMFFGSKQTRCPICANNYRGAYIKIDNYLGKLLNDAVDGKDYEWLEEYTGDNKYKHLIKHKKCNERSLLRPNDFQQGYRCTNCFKSKYESMIAFFLDELEVTYRTQATFRDDDGIPFRFDFCLDLDNSQKLLIEVDGEFHDTLQSTKNNDKKKNTFISSKENLNLRRIHHTDDLKTKLYEILMEFC